MKRTTGLIVLALLMTCLGVLAKECISSLDETFDGAEFPPASWQAAGSATTSTSEALSAPNSVILSSAAAAIITPSMCADNNVFSFRYLNKNVGDMLRIEYSVDGGANWIFYRKHTASPDYWAGVKVDLTKFNAISVKLRLSWEEYNDPGALVYVDNCQLKSPERGVQVAPVDFDGDKKSDAVAYNPANGGWTIHQSSDGQIHTANWGWAAASPVPADYDGDGITDLAVFSGGWWYINSSLEGPLAPINYGFDGCIPVPADFNGDGAADLALYYLNTGTWFIKFLNATINSETSAAPAHATISKNWGFSGASPAPADFDGDGIADIAVNSMEFGTWYILTSKSHYTDNLIVKYGWSALLPITGDFNGDGTVTPGGYYSAQGLWMAYGSDTITPWGWSDAIPMLADYDGDGITDFAVAASVENKMYCYIKGSSSGPQTPVDLGASNTVPVSSDGFYNYMMYLSWLMSQ